MKVFLLIKHIYDDSSDSFYNIYTSVFDSMEKAEKERLDFVQKKVKEIVEKDKDLSFDDLVEICGDVWRISESCSIVIEEKEVI